MRAGRLRDRITIRREADVDDGQGGFSRGWTTVADRIAAEVVGQSGREALIASALQGVRSYRITIRTRSGAGRPRESDQILYRPPGAAEDEELNIRSVLPARDAPTAALDIFADTEAPQGAGAEPED